MTDKPHIVDMERAARWETMPDRFWTARRSFVAGIAIGMALYALVVQIIPRI